VVVLLQPLIGSVRELHERTEPYRKQALEFASRFGIPVVDCYSVFERFKGRANDDLFTDNIHLSSKGHLLVAREIFKVLVENNIPEKLKNDRENK
jgi:lysophospholipase L1-like esterase